MTTLPAASSSRTRTGRTSRMRAVAWASEVRMPAWLPVKLMASTPWSCSAIDSSAIEMRSPAVSSMSSSRRGGSGETCLASRSRSSVVSPMADTTTQTGSPARRRAATRAATRFSFSTSPTEEPPNFWTTTGIAPPPTARDRAAAAGRRQGIDRGMD